MAHAALSTGGSTLNGPDAVIGGLLDAVGRDGTVLTYTDWDSRYEMLGPDGRVPEEWRPYISPFDPRTSRAARGNGASPESLRTWPGARPSGQPGAAVAALGARAVELAADHQQDSGDGDGSLLASKNAFRCKVLLLGGPLETITLLNHAEPVVAGLNEDDFATILTAFLATGHGAHGKAAAASLLVGAPAVTAFAVQWLQERLG